MQLVFRAGLDITNMQAAQSTPTLKPDRHVIEANADVFLLVQLVLIQAVG